MRSRRASSNVPHRAAGFSLIELLVVIGIIVILAGLLMVAIGKVTQSAKRAKAKVQIKQIEKAFIAYHDEYGEWPVFGSENEAAAGINYDTNVVNLLNGEIVTVAGDNLNPQKIEYYDVTDTMVRQDADGRFGFVDPWKRCYKYMMDFNDDGVLEVVYSSSDSVEIEGACVAVWSQGPDGDDALTKDNVTSWKSQ